MFCKKEANVMVLGQSGSGKSSFLNYLMGDEKFKVGIGSPVTKSNIFQTGIFEYNDFQINVIDSCGLEINKLEEWKDEVTNKIKEYNDKENIHEWIHGLFYCVNVATHRIQDSEIDFIYELSKQSENIVVILTNADTASIDELNEMKTTIVNEFQAKVKNNNNNNKIKVVNVCNISKTTTQGKVEPFGKDEVLDKVFKELWSKICFNSSNKLQEQIVSILIDGFDELESLVEENDLSFSIFDIFRIKSKAEQIENSMDEITIKVDKLNDDMQSDFDKFENNFNDVCEFYNQFHKTLQFNDKFYDLNITSMIFDFDYDEVVKESSLGNLVQHFEEVDSATFCEILGTIWEGISTALNLDDKILELISELKDELIDHVENKIDSYFNKLQKEYKQ